jgi:hypothetical protein
VAATVCAEAGVTAAAASVTTKSKSHRGKYMFSSSS